MSALALLVCIKRGDPVSLVKYANEPQSPPDKRKAAFSRKYMYLAPSSHVAFIIHNSCRFEQKTTVVKQVSILYTHTHTAAAAGAARLASSPASLNTGSRRDQTGDTAECRHRSVR